MRALLQAVLAAWLALSAATAQAQTAGTVELRHRSAESVVTALRPLVAPATLSGTGTHVEVRGAAADLQRAMRLVRESDRPPQPLRVTLSDSPRLAEAPVRPQAHGAVTLSTSRGASADSYGNGQVLSTHGGARPEAVDLLEGEPLSVSMPAAQSLWFSVKGKDRAKGASAGSAGVSSGVTGSGASAGVGGAVQFEAPADFTARIWLAGEAVAITLEPRVVGRVDAGAQPDLQRSAVYGRLGQWIALADRGADPSSPAGGSGAGLWIKVEAATEAPSQ